jgi:hypothetical protein
MMKNSGFIVPLVLIYNDSRSKYFYLMSNCNAQSEIHAIQKVKIFY